MPLTTRRQYPYPTGAAAPAGPLQLQQLAEAVDGDVAGLLSKTRAGYALAGPQAIASGAAFATVAVATRTMTDTDAGFTVTAGVARVPVAGLYSIVASAVWAPNANGRRILVASVNGTENGGRVVATDVRGGFGAGETVQMVSRVVPLLAQDTVQLRVFQDSGAAVNLVVGGSYLGATTLELVRLRGEV